jgi:YD repeat-containing protein
MTARFQCVLNRLFVNEPNGTSVAYYPDPQNSVLPIIGDQFYGIKHQKLLKYNAFFKDDKGIANTKTGDISARTNLKNQYIIFDPAKDEKGKSFTLYASDGTSRRYVHQTSQKKIEGLYDKHYISYHYHLESETLPNGHMIHYKWDDKNRLTRIHTTNRRQTKTFASLTIPVYNLRDRPTSVTLTGSDERTVTYKAHPTEIKHLYVQCELNSPDLPDQTFGWDMKPRWLKGNFTKMPHLMLLSLKQQRAMKISYSDEEDPAVRQQKIDDKLAIIRNQIRELKRKAKKNPDKYEPRLNHLLAEEKRIIKHGIENEGVNEGYKVKKLALPVGIDAKLITTHTFSYDPPGKTTSVFDSHNNKTTYFWNDDYRLTRI